MVDQTKRDALRWGILAGLGVAASTHTLTARAQSVPGPPVGATIALLSKALGVELLLMRVRLLLAIMAHVAKDIGPDDLLEELQEANLMEARARDPFRFLHALREDREREAVIARLHRFRGTPRAVWVSSKLNELRSVIVALISEHVQESVDQPLIADAIVALDHVEHIAQSAEDPTSSNAEPLTWCGYPIIRCLPVCRHRCSWW